MMYSPLRACPSMILFTLNGEGAAMGDPELSTPLNGAFVQRVFSVQVRSVLELFRLRYSVDCPPASTDMATCTSCDALPWRCETANVPTEASPPKSCAMTLVLRLCTAQPWLDTPDSSTVALRSPSGPTEKRMELPESHCRAAKFFCGCMMLLLATPRPCPSGSLCSGSTPWPRFWTAPDGGPHTPADLICNCPQRNIAPAEIPRAPGRRGTRALAFSKAHEK
eukprot:scaffold773_cov114-Isochrysis_galbana.AAC.10